MKRILGPLSLMVVWLVFGWLGAPVAHAAQTNLNKQDHTFLKEAASGGKLEVELGQIAAKQASSPEVKQFGEQMVKDHSDANMRLMQITEKEGINLPKGLEKKDQQMLDRLSKLSGANFDCEYMKHMVEDHTQDVQRFQKEAQNGQNPQLKGFAADVVAKLEGHLNMAKDVDGNVAKSCPA